MNTDHNFLRVAVLEVLSEDGLNSLRDFCLRHDGDHLIHHIITLRKEHPNNLFRAFLHGYHPLDVIIIKQ